MFLYTICCYQKSVCRSLDCPEYGILWHGTVMKKNNGMWSNGISYAQKPYRCQDIDPLGTTDFIIVKFYHPITANGFVLHPIWTNANIVVRMWVVLANFQTKTISGNWKLLYVRSDSNNPKGGFYQFSDYINVVRIEFNSNLEMYLPELGNFLSSAVTTDFELVLSVPLLIDIPSDQIIFNGTQRIIYEDTSKKETKARTSGGNITETLPPEILLKIFGYLDLISLSRCAQVNKRWNVIANDECFYQEIDLKMHWNKVNTKVLNKLKKNLKKVRKLDMTWCNNDQITPSSFFGQNFNFRNTIQSILLITKNTLTHLCMDHNLLVTDEVIEIIAACPNLEELRVRNTRNWLFWNLKYNSLTKLKTLDVSMTYIADRELITILQNNPDMEHLVIDCCDNLANPQQILATLKSHNKKLKAWSSWQTFARLNNSRIYEGFGKLVHLEDLDLGFCEPIVNTFNCLETIATKCKKLKRLVLANWTRLTDLQLLPVINECKELTQLHLSATPNISSNIVFIAANNIPNLRFLNIQQCIGITKPTIEECRQKYPNLTIYYRE
ncbi:hypothetical protein ABEB36_004505 [Hypothenemus hampei]|uniref:F-box domain-containing protein n=1 Tax=Hypothenemus hampei TaxID=57062 RepID=A0ABD1F3J8_HYPHA